MFYRLVTPLYVGFDNAVISVVSLVDNIDFAGRFIEEYEERMSYHFKLRHCLDLVHGSKIERFSPYDLVRLFLLFLYVFDERTLSYFLALACEYLVEFNYLAFEFGKCEIDEIVHSLPAPLAADLRTKYRAAEENGKFHLFAVVGLAHGDFDGNVVVEILIELLYLFLDNVFKRVLRFIILGLIVDPHKQIPLAVIYVIIACKGDFVNVFSDIRSFLLSDYHLSVNIVDGRGAVVFYLSAEKSVRKAILYRLLYYPAERTRAVLRIVTVFDDVVDDRGRILQFDVPVIQLLVTFFIIRSAICLMLSSVRCLK